MTVGGVYFCCGFCVRGPNRIKDLWRYLTVVAPHNTVVLRENNRCRYFLDGYFKSSEQNIFVLMLPPAWGQIPSILCVGRWHSVVGVPCSCVFMKTCKQPHFRAVCRTYYLSWHIPRECSSAAFFCHALVQNAGRAVCHNHYCITQFLLVVIKIILWSLLLKIIVMAAITTELSIIVNFACTVHTSRLTDP